MLQWLLSNYKNSIIATSLQWRDYNFNSVNSIIATRPVLEQSWITLPGVSTVIIILYPSPSTKSTIDERYTTIHVHIHVHIILY